MCLYEQFISIQQGRRRHFAVGTLRLYQTLTFPDPSGH